MKHQYGGFYAGGGGAPETTSPPNAPESSSPLGLFEFQTAKSSLADAASLKRATDCRQAQVLPRHPSSVPFRMERTKSHAHRSELKNSKQHEPPRDNEIAAQNKHPDSAKQGQTCHWQFVEWWHPPNQP